VAAFHGSIGALDSSSRSRRERVWLLVALTLLVGAAFPYLASMMNANERPRILQAIAWVDTGELRVDGVGARGIDPGIDLARSPVDGHLYPNKPPGATVPAIVAYSLVSAVSDSTSLRDVTRAARLFGGVLPTILLCWFLLRQGATRSEPRWTTAAVVLYVMATPALSYGRLLFGPPLTALLLTVGVAWLVAPGTDAPRLRTFAGGMLAGAAVTVEYAAVFAGVPIAVYLLQAWWRDRDHARLGSALAGAMVPIVGLAAYHAAVFGSPLATGYHHATQVRFAQTHAQGLLGLGLPTAHSLYEHLLSPWGGLLVWAPLWALAAVVAGLTWRRASAEARLGAAIFGVMLMVNLGLQQTGGWRVGPRYLVGFFPLLLPAVIELLRAAVRRPLLGVAVVALAGWSLAANFLAAHLFPHLIDKGNPLADQLLPLWLDGKAPYNWLSPLLGPVGSLHALELLALAVVGWALWRLPWGEARSRVLGLGLLGAIVSFVVGLAPASADDAPYNLEAIESIWEPTVGGNRITIVIEPLAQDTR
jgi:hypothetical protein